MTRVALGKKIRFEIFKRDLFICQYCGSTPPGTILEVDHIIPVSKGGANKEDNLITACFDCNRGKSNNELSSLPESTQRKTEILKEKELQYKAFQKLQNDVEKRINAEIEKVNELYTFYFPEYELSDSFKRASVKSFISKLGLNEVRQSMETACLKVDNSTYVLRYFCGICWNKIKNR